MNTTEFLTITATICPDKTAIISEGKRFTYGKLSERVNRLANSLQGLGVKKGDLVAILQVNCNEYVESYFATARLGAIFVPLNFRAKQDELLHMLRHSEASTAIVGARYLDLVRGIRKDLPKARNFIALETRVQDMAFFEDLIHYGASEEVFTEIGDDDVTILMYTAGTTGLPKGVPLTHSQFATYVLENVTPADPETAETNVLTVPLYHVAGIQAMMAGIYGGRTLALMKQFEVLEWMDTVEREQARRAMLVPTMLKRVIDHPDFAKHDLSSLQVVTYGAASMPFEVIKKAIEVMPGVRFINAFGQTETASTITMLGPEDHIIEGTPAEKAKKLKRLASSIGKAMSDVEIAILDEEGNPLSPGKEGEIAARGPRIMAGYWKDPKKTAEAFAKDGWLKTGDVGKMDEEGYIYLTGRSKDIIIRGGENISPEEVENVLYAHPAIDEAAVIGVPNPEWGEAIRAVVVLKKGHKAKAEDIIEFCRQRLSSFKKPESVVFVDELPRTSTGKVLKRDLRAAYGKP